MINHRLDQGSAKIYQFPVGGRAGLGSGHPSAPSNPGSPPANETICSGSWYHQEAIEEARPKWDR